MAKNSVKKKMVSAKSEAARVETTHVQPAPSDAALPPQRSGVPGFSAVVVGPEEGLIPREDLLSAQGMTFGDLSRGDTPEDPSSWAPTSF